MAQLIARQVIRILFLILLQGLIVNKLQLFDGLILPWVYLFGILMLPFETPRWAVLIVAFGTGMAMDLFTGPMGLHTCACTLLGFVQPHVQSLLAPREGYDISQKPTIQRMGISWYATYAGLLAVVHHTTLTFLEVLRFSSFFYQVFHIILSAGATLLLMVIGQFLIYNTKKQEA